MTLLQLIAHLKEVYEKEGNLIPMIQFTDGHSAILREQDIEVDPEAKTITFT